MENKYTIKFNNKIPTWESLKFENSGNNKSYPTIIINMEVFEKDEEKDILIYSVMLKFEGHYYCCGSQNFEYDDNKIEKTIIKNCDDTILDYIYDDLNKNYINIIDNTVLDINCDITRIFEHLCRY